MGKEKAGELQVLVACARRAARKVGTRAWIVTYFDVDAGKRVAAIRYAQSDGAARRGVAPENIISVSPA